jgi:hypothetical protein
VSTRSPHARRKHAWNTTAAGRPCLIALISAGRSNAPAETSTGSSAGTPLGDGLRRALDATRGQIRTRFLAEPILLAVIGGVGMLAGATAHGRVRRMKSWAVVIPVEAWSGGSASAILIGSFAGLMPAVAWRTV